jgi:hypothetical protein
MRRIRLRKEISEISQDFVHLFMFEGADSLDDQGGVHGEELGQLDDGSSGQSAFPEIAIF